MEKRSWSLRVGYWFLQKIYDEDLLEDVSGDLEELYHQRLEVRGKSYASLHHLKDVLLSVRNIDLKRKKSIHAVNESVMLKNLIIIAFRSLRKRLSYSLLNIAGLATSITFAFLLWIYISNQNSYDKHFANEANIYRVNIDCDMNGKRDVYSNVPQPVALALKNDYSDIKSTLRIALTDHTAVLEYENKKIKSEKILIAEGTLFQFFDREFISGIPDKALVEPNSIIISESLAEKTFGSIDVMGKALAFPAEKKVLKITGVIKDDDRPSHIPLEAAISWSTFPEYELDWWYGGHAYTYILLHEGSQIQNLDNQMPAFFNKYMKKTFDEFNGKGKMFFQPLKDIYLSEELVWEPYPHGSKTNVIALTLITLFLIVFAVINYINMATARAAERASEVGIRKVLGSSQHSLWIQFFSESILLSLSAGLIALPLAWIMLPYFNELTDMGMIAQSFFTIRNTVAVLLLALCTGIVAGIFPAIYLSSLKTIKVLKGKFSSSTQGDFLRKGLVTIQFLIAALLITGILVVYQQISFIKNKDIGFDKENLVNIRIPNDSLVRKIIPSFINEIKTFPQVLSASVANLDLHREANSFSPVLRNEDGSTFRMGADIIVIDADFIKTIDAKMVAGRNFRENSTTEMESYILINETAANKFGWSKNPLGGTFAGWTLDEPANRKVLGVVKDFHLGFSYQLIHPTIIMLSEGVGYNLYVRIDGTDIKNTIRSIESSWHKSIPDFKMELSFVDETLDSLYNREEKFLQLLTVFCFIVLFIASLGVIGLISYTTQLRKKEIAIRKVLGSSARSIITLLSGKFIRLLLLANLLALPFSWYLLNLWLTNFAYHIEMGAIPFLVAFVVCFVFTLLSLVYHTIQAATRNPIDSLKYE